MTGPPDPHRRAIARLRAAWAAPGGPPPVLFGPRRQGKTTLVRRLAGSPHLLGGDARAAVLNLQAVDWTDGAADLCHAIAFALWQADPDGLAEPAPEDYERGPLAALRLLLSRLERAAPPRRYILVLDEYELLDELDPGEGTAILGALRAPAWLAVALVGLRPPDECAGGLREALAGAPAIPVGRLGRAAFAALLRAGDPVRPSRFAPDALDRAFALAAGQPFLGTLLAELLARRAAPGAGAPPTFTAADVDAVAETPEFALGARPYYRGHWARAGEDPPEQRRVLEALARHGGGLEVGALRAESGLDPAAFAAALAALERHDALERREGRCRYAVELLRRQVAGGGMAFAG